MALDRQKILNELGSVMNQLKNTDCGCMGKLFGDSEKNVVQTNNTPTFSSYRHGCCHSHNHGLNSLGTCLNNGQNIQRPCMGQCNAPKLFADTYGYLNENLMKPTINEVYNDLKTITPANTITNNSMADQLGLPRGQFATQNNMGMPAQSYMAHENKHTKPDLIYDGVNNMSQHNNPIGNFEMGGMGPQIVNMFGEKGTPKNMEHQGHVFQPNTESLEHPNNTSAIPISRNIANYNQTYPANQSNNMNINTQSHQNVHKQQIHGQHAQGIAKFNEMFPGVMKNGDLGFDPMSIAIQMNPANQKQVAMDTIHKIMNNNNDDNAINLSNVPVNNNVSNQPVNPNNTELGTKPDAIQQQIIPNQITSPSNMYVTSPPEVNQQVYTASMPLEGQKPQTLTNPTLNPQLTNGQGDLQNGFRKLPEIQSSITRKEAILPADNSRFVPPSQKYYEYNTLGQPVEMLPAKKYHAPDPGLPQTLSPQPTINPKNDIMKHSNVKSTISKTSLMSLQPIGKTASKNQLQQIYNNYKGSHSYTQQNVSPNVTGGTYSDGKLNVPQGNLLEQKIEKIGGDTFANNQVNNEIIRKIEPTVGQIGDAPVTNKILANIPEKKSPVSRKYRNGLQDIVYTSYPTSAAWSFHGEGRVPHPITGRYCKKL